MSENPVYARFIWREPSTGHLYDVEDIMNLAVVPRVGEAVTLNSEGNDIHSFAFLETFLVEKVTYKISSAPSTSADPEENWKTLAHEQSVHIYVQPQDKHGWATLQAIKKGFDISRKKKAKDV